MDFTPIGDLARNLQLREQSARLSRDVARLSDELASGRPANPGVTLGGAFGVLAATERSLTLLAGFERTITEAATRGEALQTALGRVVASARSAADAVIIGAAPGSGAAGLVTASAVARGAFLDSVSALNATAAGQSLFAGRATDGPALQPGEAILAALATVTAGLTDAASLRGAVADFFTAPGGNFETTVYLGTPETPSGLRLSETQAVRFDVTAADPRLRETLAALALGVLAGSASGLAEADRRDLAREAGTALLAAGSGVTGLQAEIGQTEARIAEARTANAAERAASEIARNDLLRADPSETALALQRVSGQLETLFALTARLSQFTFANFLR